MDIIDDSDMLTAFSGLGPSDIQDIDFRELEDFITKDEPDLYFPDINQPTVTYAPLVKETSAPISISSKQPLLTHPTTVTLKQNIDHYNKNTPIPTSTCLQSNQEFNFQPGALPESPPDSSSEPYSPPEVKPDLRNGTVQISQPQVQIPSPPSVPPPVSGTPIMYTQPPTQVVTQPQMQVPTQVPPQMMSQLPTQAPVALTSYLTANPPQLSHLPTTEAQGMLDSLGHQNKKRKHSDSPTSTVTPNTMAPNMLNMVQVKQEPQGVFNDCSVDFDFNDPRSYVENSYQCIKWQPFQTNKWCTLVDAQGKELPSVSYRVEADKGFNYSISDDAFVCQKKNHFQVTVHIGLAGHPKYVKVDQSLKLIERYFLHLYGVKVESVNSEIKIEQSQSDRSKKPFYPVHVDLPLDQVTKVTVGRLHFSETTSNNMRKKGKPNPDQRYFMLTVALHAHYGDNSSSIAASASERIIVRASNPGQFENDVDVSHWQKGHNSDNTVFHLGRVGINTDRPEEALAVHGDVRVTGNILHPSDLRVKENIVEADSKEQLRHVAKLRLVQYNYKPEYADHVGLSEADRKTTGVLAQDVKDIMPEAVKETGDLILPNGRIDNFLIVNKDRIYMENIGAVKELCKLTDNLENRIDELEKMNSKLSKLKRLDSIKSTSSGGTINSRGGSNPSSIRRRDQRSSSCRRHHQRHHQTEDSGCLSQKFMQGVIIALILIMLFCLAAMATLYALELENNRSSDDNTMVAEPLQPTQTPFNVTSGVISTIRSTVPINPGDSGHQLTTKPAVQPSTTPCIGEGCRKYCCILPTGFGTPPIDSQPDSSPVPGIAQMHRHTTEALALDQPITPSDGAQENESIQEQISQDEEVTVTNTEQDYNVNNQKERVIYEPGSPSRRRKRAESTPKPDTDLEVTSMRIPYGNKTITQENCDLEECGNGTFSYTVSVPVYFPLIWTNLEINTSVASNLWLCKHTMITQCLDYLPQESDKTMKEGYSGVLSTHLWDLPIGLYFESTYKFRITYASDTTVHEDCSNTNGTYLDYVFTFKRDLSLCSAENETPK
ncbi:myelin regulatory factor-like isoform X1 [Glandiceps talaboti]